MRYSVYEINDNSELELAQFLLEYDAEKFRDLMAKLILSAKYEVRDNYEKKVK